MIFVRSNYVLCPWGLILKSLKPSRSRQSRCLQKNKQTKKVMVFKIYFVSFHKICWEFRKIKLKVDFEIFQRLLFFWGFQIGIFIYYTRKTFQKSNILTPWYGYVHMWAYQGLRNISFLGKFCDVINELSYSDRFWFIVNFQLHPNKMIAGRSFQL